MAVPAVPAVRWGWVAALLAGYGFLKEVRPSEPYITPFLTGPDKNFTEEQVNQSIYPVSTYSTLALLVVVFLVTDFLRYKPVIVVQGLSAVATYVILAWGQGIPMMQLVEVIYGLMWAADVAYFTYVYAKVGREHYGAVSAAARVGYLLGRSFSGLLSQLTVSLGIMTLLDLQYVTLAASVAATLVALTLPPVATSFYFHKAPAKPAADGEPPPLGIEPQPPSSRAPHSALLRVAGLLWLDCREAFGQRAVVKWSAWWALATAGQMQVYSYYQILWLATVRENGNDETLWNGATEAALTLLGAIVVWLTTRRKDYSSWGDALMCVFFLASGAIWVVAADSHSMALQYGASVTFGAAFHAAITIAYSEVAKRVREDAHALVFGLNTLAGLLIQTVLTVAVAGDGGLELDIRAQFLVYGCYFLLIGVVLLVTSVFARTRGSLNARNTFHVQT